MANLSADKLKWSLKGALLTIKPLSIPFYHIDKVAGILYTEGVINDLNTPFSMPRPLMFAATAPAAVEEVARTLGSRIRLARMRRRIPLREMAERAGVNHKTAAAVEAGSLLTGLGAYLALIWALGLEREVAKLLDPDRDEEGKQLELARTPKRARAKKGSTGAEF